MQGRSDMKRYQSRRDFFKTSTLLSSILVLANVSGLQAKPVIPAASLKLGLMTYNLAKDWDLDTIIHRCTETQYEHVELRTTHAHGVEVTLSARERRNVKKRFEVANLKLSLASAFKYHWAEPEKVRKHIEGTKEYTLLAEDIGALGIRVFPNSLMVDKGIPEEHTLKQIGEALAEVGEFGHAHGVEIRVCVHGKGTDCIPRIKKMIRCSIVMVIMLDQPMHRAGII
jgi:sugar phosphate isomerase/epimerase